MLDREKVMKGLECCIVRDPDAKRNCVECPYNHEGIITNAPCANGLMADALALLKEQEPRWIPVTERLPENDSGVLAFYDDGIESRIIPATFHPKSGWYDCLFNMPSENISYWMPLPEPPKMDKEEDSGNEL